MDDSSIPAAHELAKSLLGVNEATPACLREWLVQAELRAADEQVQALHVLAGYSHDEERFAWSQERVVAQQIDVFGEECAKLNASQRQAKAEELAQRLASISIRADIFPHLVSRIDSLRHVLAITLKEETLAKVTSETRELVDRLLQQSLLSASSRAAARRTLLEEAYTDKKAWSKHAAAVKRHFKDVASLDMPLIEELTGLRSRYVYIRVLAVWNGPVDTLLERLDYLVIPIAIAGLFFFWVTGTHDEASNSSNRPVRSTTKSNPSENLMQNSQFMRDAKLAELLVKRIQDGDGSIVDQVELACCRLRLSRSQELRAMSVISGKQPNELDRAYMMQARQALPQEYRPPSPFSIEDILKSCRDIAADHEPHAFEILTHAAEAGAAVRNDKSTSSERRAQRYNLIGTLYRDMIDVTDVPSLKRASLESAIEWQFRAIEEAEGDASALNVLCESISQFAALSEDEPDEFPDFLLRTRNEADNFSLADWQHKRLMLHIAEQMCRAHHRFTTEWLGNVANEHERMYGDDELAEHVVATLKRVKDWTDSDLIDLARNEAFRSLASDVEFRRLRRELTRQFRSQGVKNPSP